MRVLYMIGHSNLEWSQFVHLLEKHQINRLIDVRTFPYSRFPHFCAGFLKRTLPPGMYQHAVQLGGKKVFEPPAVRRALAQVLDAANGGRLCLMCSEGNFRQCHRHHQLTPLVIELGWRVLQITRDGELIEDHGPTGHASNRELAF